MDKKDLWLALEYYNFSNLVPAHLWDHVTEAFGGVDASTKAFANKIARKLGWTPKFALRAISEYKKFVFLGVTSDFAVTPSKVIDQVWHEHLLFSKAYREFCSDVIGYTFDHNPELIPVSDQTETFGAQYMDTIKLYKTEFGIDPPTDIWSVPKFDKKVLRTQRHESKKKVDTTPDNASYSDNTPLFLLFDSPNDVNTHHNAELESFGGGSSGGAGASGTWENANSFEGASSYSDSGSSTDSTSSDSGSSCSSCSSCSSGGGGGD